MALDKLTKLTSNSGISTVIDYTMSDLVVDSINIAGGGTTLGKDFETRNLKVTGLSTFVGNVQMDGNLTVNGTTTTLDTNLIGVDRVEVVANDNNYAGIAVTQSGTGDIISAYDGSTQVFVVSDGNRVGIADSIYHLGDTNTAFGFPSADTFKIDTAGVERFRISSSGAAKVTGTLELTDALYWDGDTNTTIDNAGGTADWIRFKSGGTTVMDINASQNVHIHDDRQLIIGGGSDLKLYHSSSTNKSYVTSTTHDVIHAFNVGKPWTLQTTAADKRIHCPTTKSVELYWNGTKKFETDQTGVIVTGIATATSVVSSYGGIVNKLTYISGGAEGYTGTTSNHALFVGTAGSNRIKIANNSAATSIGGAMAFNGMLTVQGDISGQILHLKATEDTSRLMVSGTDANGVEVNLYDAAGGQKGILGVSGTEFFIKAPNSSAPLTFYTHNGSSIGERLRITNTGKIYIGATSSGTYDGIQPHVQLEGTDYNTSSMSLFCNSNSSNNAPQLQLGKSRSGSDGGSTALQDDDRVGSIYGIAADGTDRNSSVASIQFYVDGTVASNTTPGSIRFATTATTSGSSTPTERLRIDSDGRLLVNGAAATNAFVGGDDLIIGNASSGTRSGMTLVSHSGQDGGIYFSRGTSSNSDYVKGQLVYNHANDYFAIYTGGTGIRLKISDKGGHNITNASEYAAANLAECNNDAVALNIRQTRAGQTKGIAIGAIGTNTQTGLQAYDSSNNSANNFNINPFGGYLGIGLGAGNDPNELLHIRSSTSTAPLIEIEHNQGTGFKAQIGLRGNDLEIRGSSGQMEFYNGTIDGASSVERMRIKDDGKIGMSQGANVPLTALHILDNHNSSWDGALTKSRSVLRLETHWNAQTARAIGDYGAGIVWNHLGGHGSQHNDNAHAWMGLRVWDTPGHERSALIFATNDQTGNESTHDSGLKERMSITPYGQVVINNPTNNQMTSSSHAKLWVEADGINLTEYSVGDNEGSQPHFTLAGLNSHVRLDMGTMDVNPYGGYIQARFDNAPDLGATDSDGLEPLMLQPKGGATTFNFGHSTTMPGNFDPDSPYGIIRMRAGRAASTSINDDTMAVKIWPAEERVHSGQKGEQDQGTKYGGIGWLVLDGQTHSGWAAYDGTQCWQGMSLHSTPGQELANWQLRMNDSGNANSHANNIALQASPQGWVTKPNLPAFHVGTPNIAGGSSGSVWRCHANSLWLNRGNHYDNNNGRFTAPINGLYYFFFWGMSTSGHNATMDVYSRLEGTRDQIGTAYESNGGSSGGYHQFTAQFIRELTKGQYVDIYTSNGNVYNGSDGRHGGWGGWLIG